MRRMIMWGNGLDYSVAAYGKRGNLVEWIAVTRAKDAGRACYDLAIATWPKRRFILRQRTRVVYDSARATHPD